MNIKTLNVDRERYGLARTVFGLGMRAVNRVAYCHVFRGLGITEPDASYLHLDPPFTHRFLDDASLHRFAQDETLDLPRDFVDDALAKGDRCYGVIDRDNGDSLASYGWYSTRPTALSDDLVLRFDPSYPYMYKGFTHPRYRGQRLHAIGMTWALRRLRDEGLLGLVSYVDATNFASLKSTYRMGYRAFGNLYVLRAAGRYLLASDPGCAAYGFRIHEAKKAHVAEEAAAQAIPPA